MPFHDIETRVSSWCAKLLPPRTAVLVAVSGGSDSTALLWMLHGLRERLGIERLGILHVNHGLRGSESDEDETFVTRMAQQLNAPFFIKKLAGRSLHDRGIEEWARRERYDFFRRIKEREGFARIATGHTADDQAETVLMRLVRGSGLRGLRGILPERCDGVVRPLLPLRKHEIIAWLQKKEIQFRNDASNQDCSFRRNMIRHEVLPGMERREPGAAEKLIVVAERLDEFWRIASPGVDRWIKNFVEKTGDGFRVKKEGLGDEFHACEGLRSVFESRNIPADALHLDGVLKNGSRCSGQFLLPGAWRYYPQRTDLVFCQESPAVPGEFRYPLAVPGTTECALPRARFIAEETAMSAEESIPAITAPSCSIAMRVGRIWSFAPGGRKIRLNPWVLGSE